MQGGEQVGVVHAGDIQIGALLRCEQAAQRGKRQAWLALRQAAKHDADGLPLVVMTGAGATLEAEFAQTGQGVAFGIGAAGNLCFGTVFLRVQHAALLDREDEDEAVDQAQQLLKVVVLAERAVVQSGAQGLVGGVLQEALTECQQSLFDTIAQAVAHAGAFLLAIVAPLFPDAHRSALAEAGCAAGVQQAPDVGEFGITLATKQVGQIDFEKAGTGERGSVAQQPQLLAVADDAPLQRFAGVEQFLHRLERGFLAVAAALHGKSRVGLVQSQGVWCHQDGQGAGHEADRVTQFTHLLC